MVGTFGREFVMVPVDRIFQLIQGDDVMDGGGVRIKRLIATSELPVLDPFLLLDEIKSNRPDDYIAGFPDHPHRGFETLTYLLHGRMRHRDSAGHQGLLESGGVQRMTAGRGIIHSELPEMEEGLLHGYQLWINLPASKKMIPPSYKDHASEELPVARFEGGEARVLSGVLGETEGPIATVVPISFFDVHLESGGAFRPSHRTGESRMVVSIHGRLLLEGSEGERTEVPSGGACAIISEQDLLIRSDSPVHFFYLAGKPVREPIVRGGPFVMNTREELIQAFRDFEQGF